MATDEIDLTGSLGHRLLAEWAPWARDDRDGESWGQSVGPRMPRGYHGDPPKNFFIVDKIVAPHRVERSQYWTVVAMFYLGQRPDWEIARELGWSEQRVAFNLAAFAALVEREFKDLQTFSRYG